jgi:hypothetical protein
MEAGREPSNNMFRVIISRGVPMFEGQSKVFTVKSKNIISAQVRVLKRVFGITKSTMYFLKSAEKIK